MKNYHNLKRFVFDNLKENAFTIEGQDYIHAKNVMRLKIGNEIIGICNNGYDYLSKIVEIGKKSISCKVIEKIENKSNPNFNLTIFQALLKGEKMELVVQKATELGASNFYPFCSEYCVVKANNTRVDRLQKISQESAKQCKCSKWLNVGSTLKFEDLIKKIKDFDIVIFAYELEENKFLEENMLSIDKSIAILVGSEGGFSPKEVQKIIDSGAICISLGKRILRAETATIHLCGLVSHYLESKI